MSENKVKEQIRRAVGGLMDALLLSNPSGLGVVGEIQRFRPGAPQTIVKYPRWVKFGLGGGKFPDMIGMKTIVITPDMVGKEIAVPFYIEAKRQGKIPRVDQSDKIALLRSFGARAGYATTADEALRIVHGQD